MVAPVTLCFTLSLNKQQQQQRRLPTAPQSLSSPQQILVPSRGQTGLPAELPSSRVSRLFHYVILQGSKGPLI